MSVTPEIRIAADGGQWAHEAAAVVHSITTQAVETQGRALLALSGGSTPRALYRRMTEPPWKDRMPWRGLHFFFGDERCVPPDHPESNFAMANNELFQPLQIDPQRISRMEGESPDPAAAANIYERTLRTVAQCPPPAIPQLDLVLLGLGDDGHTASLFPGTDALGDRTHLVTVGQAPTGIRLRLTLTLGVINRASVVLFLVTDARKAPMVRRAAKPRTAADRALPAAQVSPESGRVIWMLDQAAAAQLDSRHF